MAADQSDAGTAAKRDEDSGAHAQDVGNAETRKADPAKPSPLKKPWVRIALIVIGVVLGIAAVAWFINHQRYGRYQQSTNNAYLDADQVDVSPRVAGYVEEVFVASNQMVRRGQALARIQARDYAARVTEADAQIDQGLASIDQARAQIREQYATIAQNQAELAQSRATIRENEATRQLAAAQVARYMPLAAAGGETRESADRYRSQLGEANAQVAQSRAAAAARAAQLLQARRQIAVLEAQVSTGAAQVKTGQAQRASALVNVQGAILRATADGRIGDKQVRVGQYVQVGTRLMTVVPVDRLYLSANFKETQIGLMRIGQPAHIKVDALPGQELHGTVVSFAPGTGARFALVPTDNATGNFTKIVQRVPVRIRIDAGPEARRVLVPGLSAEASVDTRGAKDDSTRAKEEDEATKDRGDAATEQQNARVTNARPAGAGHE